MACPSQPFFSIAAFVQRNSLAGVRLKGAAYDGPTTATYSATEPMIESVMLSACTSGSDMVEWNPGDICIAEPPTAFMSSVGVRPPVFFTNFYA